MNKELGLVVPVSDLKPYAGQLLDELLTSIIEGGIDQHCEVILCLDAVADRFEYSFREKYPQFTYLPNPRNSNNRLNFSKNSNRGLRLAHNELKLPVALVNMDTVLCPWDKFKQILGPGLSTPVTVPTVEAIAAHPNTGKRESIRHKIAFYCPFFSTELLDECGYLEPGLVTFSDDLYVAMTLLAGFPVEVVDIAVQHKGSHVDQNQLGGSLSGSYDGNRLFVDFERYKKIWSIPIDIPHEKCIEYITSKFKWDRETMRQG